MTELANMQIELLTEVVWVDQNLTNFSGLKQGLYQSFEAILLKSQQPEFPQFPEAPEAMTGEDEERLEDEDEN